MDIEVLFRQWLNYLDIFPKHEIKFSSLTYKLIVLVVISSFTIWTLNGDFLLIVLFKENSVLSSSPWTKQSARYIKNVFHRTTYLPICQFLVFVQ